MVGKIVVKLSEIDFYDITVGELKKCGKFETVLVSSSQWISEENQWRCFAWKVTAQSTQNPKLAVSSSRKIQNLKEDGLDEKRMIFSHKAFSRLCRTLN